MTVNPEPSASELGDESPKPRGRPFEAGHSGNPNGRPKGARNKATVMVEQLLDGELDALVRKLIEKAKAGDIAALRLCLDRLLPPRRDRLVTFALPRSKRPRTRARPRPPSWRLARTDAARSGRADGPG
jgi:hypothetical protein